ncbi:hypothetical protein ZE40_002298 [Salmonella enterica subsp. diarizonae]|nr:hypothetical protein [Salmonella enterica]EAW1261674.1 hypothetical protein [Salmonella enterica subsp. diarizonae]EBF9340260.1 hypothetical protein [Salmonella enterica]EBK4294171.1 hypothetical protein [Salmonella enterica]EBQ8410109.1 hypothetical protein [Salmonella enterica]
MNKHNFFAQISKYSLQAQLDDLEKYISLTNIQHGLDLSKLKKAYDDDIKDAPDDYIQHLDEHYSEQYDFLTNIQPNIFNKSSLVSLYSCLEHNLNDFCNICQKIKGTEISVTDLHGDGIHKAKKYLTKLMNVNFGASQEWEFIIDLNKVRNCIVHANGNINKMSTTSKLKNIVDNTPGLSLKNSNIIVSSGYLINGIAEINKFFIWLYDLISKKSS